MENTSDDEDNYYNQFDHSDDEWYDSDEDFTKLRIRLLRELNTTISVDVLGDIREECCAIPLSRNTYIIVEGLCGGYDHIGILRVDGCSYDFMNKREFKLFLDELPNTSASWKCVWLLKYYCESTGIDEVVDIVMVEVRKIQSSLNTT